MRPTPQKCRPSWAAFFVLDMDSRVSAGLRFRDPLPKGRAGVAELVDAVALGATVLVTCRFESCPRYQKNPARVGRLMRRRPRPATLM